MFRGGVGEPLLLPRTSRRPRLDVVRVADNSPAIVILWLAPVGGPTVGISAAPKVSATDRSLSVLFDFAGRFVNFRRNACICYNFEELK